MVLKVSQPGSLGTTSSFVLARLDSALYCSVSRVVAGLESLERVLEVVRARYKSQLLEQTVVHRLKCKEPATYAKRLLVKGII